MLRDAIFSSGPSIEARREGALAIWSALSSGNVTPPFSHGAEAIDV